MNCIHLTAFDKKKLFGKDKIIFLVILTNQQRFRVLDGPGSVREFCDIRQGLHNDGGGGADAACGILHLALVFSGLSRAHFAHTQLRKLHFQGLCHVVVRVRENFSLVQLNLGRHWSAVSSLPGQVGRWDSSGDSALEQNVAASSHNLVSARVNFHSRRVTS